MKAANGKELPAHVVISKSLKEMKKMILDSIKLMKKLVVR